MLNRSTDQNNDIRITMEEFLSSILRQSRLNGLFRGSTLKRPSTAIHDEALQFALTLLNAPETYVLIKTSHIKGEQPTLSSLFDRLQLMFWYLYHSYEEEISEKEARKEIKCLTAHLFGVESVLSREQKSRPSALDGISLLGMCMRFWHVHDKNMFKIFCKKETECFREDERVNWDRVVASNKYEVKQLEPKATKALREQLSDRGRRFSASLSYGDVVEGRMHSMSDRMKPVNSNVKAGSGYVDVTLSPLPMRGVNTPPSPPTRNDVRLLADRSPQPRRGGLFCCCLRRSTKPSMEPTLDDASLQTTSGTEVGQTCKI